jgi:DNA-binding response OmpR family regulator
MARILIAEDEPRIVDFVQRGLTEQGHTTTVCGDGPAAVDLARSSEVDLLLLDLGLPGLDGTEVIRQVRGRGESLPIVVLTARDDTETIVSVLDLGANDHLAKPFAIDELLARVRLRLRDTNGPTVPAGASLQAGGVRLDLRTRRASVDGVDVELSTKEFQLACVFLEHPNQVLSRTQLLDRAWDYDFAPDSNVVEVYVNYLRKKLGKHRISTVRGAGYRFCG